MNIDDLLRIAMERRASDLHLKVGNYPHLRIDGDLVPLTDQARVSAERHVEHGVQHDVGPAKAKIQGNHGNRYGVWRRRTRDASGVNVFQQRGNVGLVLRVIPTKIRALDELFCRGGGTPPRHAAWSGAGDGELDGLR